MRIYGVRLCMCVLEQIKSANGVRAGAFLGLRLPSFVFFLLDLSNIELRVSLGSGGGAVK